MDAIPAYRKVSEKVLHLRRLGMSYASIADRLEINPWMAKKAARWGTISRKHRQDSLEEVAPIRRGRPKDDWRKRFRETADAIAREMREARITEEDIDEAVSDVRSGRSSRAGKDETAVVTITAR